GRDRGLRARDRNSLRGQGAAGPGFRGARLSGGPAPYLPLPRPAARNAAQYHHEAVGDHAVDPPSDARGRLQRVPDTDSYGFEPRGGARLPGAQPPSSRQVLRAAAGAAAVQAAADDFGLRSVLPDRALLP